MLLSCIIQGPQGCHNLGLPLNTIMVLIQTIGLEFFVFHFQVF